MKNIFLNTFIFIFGLGLLSTVPTLSILANDTSLSEIDVSIYHDPY